MKIVYSVDCKEIFYSNMREKISLAYKEIHVMPVEKTAGKNVKERPAYVLFSSESEPK